ncbi:MAG: type II secretion system protein GspL [Burkholderiales bacterium]|nr:type II secretion system protein GspL [Burkholderiales bacterium]
MRRLYLMLPEALPERLETVAWQLQEGASGVDALSRLPRADELWLVLPAARVLLTELALDARALRRLGGALAYALEERLLQEPEAVHVALGPAVDGRRCAAVVERAWLDQALQLTRAAGLTVHGALPATLLWRPASGEAVGVWTVVLGEAAHVRTGECSGFACDGGGPREPPPALVLAVQAARAQGRPPARVLCDAATAPVDVAAWGQALGCAVEVVPLRPGLPPFNLLQGEYAVHTVLRQQLARYRPALLLIAAALALHLSAAAVHTAWLAYQAQQLRAQAVAIFRAAFPQAQAVVDPWLQMRRQLEALRAERGYAQAQDLLAMLAALAPEVGPASAWVYTPGRLELRGAVVANLPALQGRLSLTPYRLEAAPEATGRYRLVLSLPTP